VRNSEGKAPPLDGEGLGWGERKQHFALQYKWIMADGLNRVIAFDRISGEIVARRVAQQMRLRQRPAEPGKPVELRLLFRKRNARKINAQEFSVSGSVCALTDSPSPDRDLR